MGFVRTKTIKGKKYAYIVENKWTTNGPRQKSKKYLGRVYAFPKEKIYNFSNFYKNYNLEIKNSKELLQDLIKLELFNHGFIYDNGLWNNGDCIADVKKLKFLNEKGKNIVFSINEGLLCKPLIDKILKFKINSKEKYEKEGYELAKLLVEAGLKIEPEIFIRIYELTKQTNSAL